jgi:hypothetical protein
VRSRSTRKAPPLGLCIFHKTTTRQTLKEMTSILPFARYFSWIEEPDLWFYHKLNLYKDGQRKSKSFQDTRNDCQLWSCAFNTRQVACHSHFAEISLPALITASLSKSCNEQSIIPLRWPWMLSQHQHQHQHQHQIQSYPTSSTNYRPKTDGLETTTSAGFANLRYQSIIPDVNQPNGKSLTDLPLSSP